MFWISCGVSVLLGAYLYIRFQQKFAARTQFLNQLPSGKEIEKMLEQQFTGYIFSMDVLAVSSCESDAKRVSDLMNRLDTNYFCFDVRSAISEAPHIDNYLRIRYFHVLIAVKNGKVIREPIKMPIKHPMLEAVVEQYVRETERQLIG